MRNILQRGIGDRGNHANKGFTVFGETCYFHRYFSSGLKLNLSLQDLLSHQISVITVNSLLNCVSVGYCCRDSCIFRKYFSKNLHTALFYRRQDGSTDSYTVLGLHFIPQVLASSCSLSSNTPCSIHYTALTALIEGQLFLLCS